MSLVYQILGALLILFGLPLFWTPIPIGLIMIASGIALIISNSDVAREWVRTLREKHPKFDAWLHRAEARVPAPFDRILKQTHVRERAEAEPGPDEDRF
ncbi:MAG: hypothetical protein ACLFQ5_06830 [Oceanicaulis sp.]